jgi:hypothetical protein
MDAIGTFTPHPWEASENPQSYSLMKEYALHPKPSQHKLGIVGGNEVGFDDREKQVQIESDLRGITRANTFCPEREHLPVKQNATEILRDTPKGKVKVPITTKPLNASQMWAYPATLAPEPFTIETCTRPEKY